MLDFLAKKDNLWRDIAFRFTNDKDSANELVQNMYLRILDYNCEQKKLTTSFVTTVLYNLFKYKKKGTKKSIKEVEFNGYNLSEDCKIETTTKQDYYQKKANKLSKEEKELLILSYDYSLRDVAEILDTTYLTVHRKLGNARIKVLRENYSKEYKNRRKKW